MPGTVGSLLGLGVFFLLKGHYFLYFPVIILLFFLGIWSSSLAEDIFNKKDPPQVIIDEFFAMLFILSFLPQNTVALIGAFFLFRLFDIIKIYPIKKIQGLKGGIGIMLDDCVAGVYAIVIVQAVFKFVLKSVS